MTSHGRHYDVMCLLGIWPPQYSKPCPPHPPPPPPPPPPPRQYSKPSYAYVLSSILSPFCHLSPSLWETARYRLKYCLKGPLNPKTTNQPTLESILMSYLMFDHKLNGVLAVLSAIGLTVHILQNTLDNILVH